MKFKYFYQNEEDGADVVDAVSAAPQTAPKVNTEEDDTVKKTLKKLRDEADAANKRAKQLEEQLKERQRLDEEEKAKRTGDFEQWKERLRSETAAQIEAERKARIEEVSATVSDAESLKQEWKHEKIVSAFSKYLKPEFAERFAKIPDYQNLVEVTKNDNGRYSIVVVESLSDRTPRFKSDGKKTVPFTLDDLADLIANEIPTAAKPLNRASGDNIANGNGNGKGGSNWNMTASPTELTARAIGLR